jgi:hypothetical protein
MRLAVPSNRGASSGGGGKPSDSGPSGDQSSPSSDGGSSDDSGTLYKAWMTGFSYEACRSLYLPGEVPPPRTDDQVMEYRDRILPWLSTYLNLLSEWSAAGIDQVTDDLEQMMKDVQKTVHPPHLGPPATTAPPAAPALLEQGEDGNASADDKFDSDFDVVIGAIRAKDPYGRYAALFGEYSSRLTHLREGDTVAKLADAIRDNLCEMKNVLPDGAYEVIDSDLQRLEGSQQGGMVKELEKDVADGVERPFEKRLKESGGKTKPTLIGQGFAKRSAGKRMLDEEIRTWTDLMFGMAAPEDILTARGTALAHTFVVLVGLGLILGIGLVILVVLTVVAHIPGMDISSLSLNSGKGFISSVETVSTTLTTVGLSLGLLVTKA